MSSYLRSSAVVPWRWRAGGLLLLLLIGMGTAVARGQTTGDVISLESYRARLESALAQLESGVPLDQVRADLATIQAVRLPGGDIVSVRPILDVSGGQDDPVLRLRLVIEQLERATSEDVAGRLAQLEQVLERLPRERLSLWERVLRWFQDLLRDLFPESAPAANPFTGWISTGLVWFIVVIGGTLLIALLTYWLRGVLGGLLSEAEIRRRRESGLDLPVSADQARLQAGQLAASGDYRQAVRQLYLSALLHLKEQDLLTFEPHQTNHEVLAQTGPETALGRHLAPVVSTFDRVWYGIQEPDHQTFDRYSGEIDALMNETREKPSE